MILVKKNSSGFIFLFFMSLFIFSNSGAQTSASGVHKGAPNPQPFPLIDPGVNGLVDYAKYGKFYGIGTSEYKYVVTDSVGLATAVGEGIYPNTSALKDPAFLAIKGQLKFPDTKYSFWLGDMWNPQAIFFQWVCSTQDDATKTMMAARIFQESKMWVPALKAYQAVMVQFPTASRANSNVSWTWNISYGNVARGSILFILREHPELGLEYKDGIVEIQNTGKEDQTIGKINPGYFVKATPKPPVKLTDVIQTRPSADSKVKLVQYSNHHWLMWVDNKPYMIRGLGYGVTKIGQSPDLQNQVSCYDVDNLHGVFDSWVDKNGSYQRTADEPAIGDQNLLKQMGCNTIRNYYCEDLKSINVMERFWKEAGIRFSIGTAFGMYGMDTDKAGGGWDNGTNYCDPNQQQAILDAVKRAVMRFKDKPYTLCYILGNENNYNVHCNAGTYPAVYCDLLERACQLVHKLDTNHPVGPSVGEGFADQVIRYAPDVDFIGINVYRGKSGMGDLWETVRKQTDRPVIITEFGAPAYYDGVGEDGDVQAEYVGGNWKDMWYNRGGGQGYGNSLGGFVFQWADEWWKDQSMPPNVHSDKIEPKDAPFADGEGHEEWYGITGQGNGNDSPAMRELRKTYWVLKDLWTGKYGTAP